MKLDLMPVVTEKQIVEIEEAANYVWHNYYKEIYSKEQIEYMLKKFQSKEAVKKQMSEGYLYYMLMCDENFAGYLCIQIQSDCIFISRLYIKPEYRRQGLSKRLIAHVDSIFSSKENELNHIKKLKLNVERKNIFAINVYEHLGFKRVRSVDTDIGKGFLCKEFVMERKVAGV